MRPADSADSLIQDLGTPISVLWTWPSSDGVLDAWLTSLASTDAGFWLDAEHLEAWLADATEGAGAPADLEDGDIAVVRGRLRPETAEAVALHLPPGATLVVGGAPRPQFGAVPHRLFAPRRLHGDSSPELDLDALGAAEREVLSTVVAVAGVDGMPAVPADLWRRAFRWTPELSAAFERLAWDWALVGDHAPRRADLRRALGDAGPPPTRRLRRLAAAAAECGRADVAVRALAAAGAPGASGLFSVGFPSVEAHVSAPPPPLTSTVSFRVSILGVPKVRRLDDAGEHAIQWRLHRSLLAVARLALAPDHRLPRDELVEALFPEQSAAHIKRNFHPTLSTARRALGGGLAAGVVQRHGIYALDPSLGWDIDVEAFDRLLTSALARDTSSERQAEEALAELEAAWRLYRGPLLEGFEADWIDGPRRRQRGHYLSMLRNIGRLAAGLGRETLALDAYRRLLLDEPFEEKVHLELMDLYGRRGRRDLVRRQFVHLQELLKDLHAEPAEETIERYHQLMR
ncbi:MAG: bacterial transcriptional activator domain-containing protein [Acidobacteriota bacterium]